MSQSDLEPRQESAVQDLKKAAEKQSSSTAGENVRSRFAAEAEQPDLGFWREFALFLRHSPSWWLAPLIFMLILLGLAVTLIPAEAVPFIYTLW